MEDKLFDLCNKMVEILKNLKENHAISGEELETHLQNKLSFLRHNKRNEDELKH